MEGVASCQGVGSDPPRHGYVTHGWRHLVSLPCDSAVKHTILIDITSKCNDNRPQY